MDHIFILKQLDEKVQRERQGMRLSLRIWKSHITGMCYWQVLERYDLGGKLKVWMLILQRV